MSVLRSWGRPLPPVPLGRSDFNLDKFSGYIMWAILVGEGIPKKVIKLAAKATHS